MLLLDPIKALVYLSLKLTWKSYSQLGYREFDIFSVCKYFFKVGRKAFLKQSYVT